MVINEILSQTLKEGEILTIVYEAHEVCSLCTNQNELKTQGQQNTHYCKLPPGPQHVGEA